MKRNVIETILGALVLLVAAVFLAFAYRSSGAASAPGYNLEARFNSIDGLMVGSDVRMGGVKVGSVRRQYLDPEYYEAVVVFTLQQDIKLPVDSQISISSNGLLGGKYVKIVPGGSDALVAPGGQVTNTKDVVSLEEMLGRVIFLVTDEEE